VAKVLGVTPRRVDIVSRLLQQRGGGGGAPRGQKVQIARQERCSLSAQPQHKNLEINDKIKLLNSLDRVASGGTERASAQSEREGAWREQHNNHLTPRAHTPPKYISLARALNFISALISPCELLNDTHQNNGSRFAAMGFG